MALDAGEVYVVCGAKLDSGSFARADAAWKSQLEASNKIQASIDRSEAASNRLHNANERWAKAAVVGAKAAGISVLGIATALGGAAIQAAKFDASMRNVNSIAGLSEGGLKKLEAQILRLSTAVGKSPTELADGLYSIVSSGFKANDAMKILEAGARAARAGLTDTATATQALTGTLKAYGLGAGSAKTVSDLLFQTVNVGVENFEQLAGSLGKVESSGHALGVSLKDLLAAQAALTGPNNSADEASTQLGALFSSLTKSSPALTKQLKALGYENGQTAIQTLGFKGTLDALHGAVGDNQTALGKLFPNIRALRGFNGLEGTASAADQYTKAVKAMDEATKGAGVTARVFAEQQRSTSAQFDDLKAAVDVAAVTIGSALLPEINKGIGALSKWFAAAEKSGEIDRWAHEIAQGVNEIVSEMQHLEPVAKQAFLIVAETVQAALPLVEELYHVLQEVAPQLEDVAHAAGEVAKVLGPGPLLAAGAAFLTVRRGAFEAETGVGRFASIMLKGQQAAALAGGGFVSTTGRINAVGKAAAEAESSTKIFARGLVSTVGNGNLIAAGAAGIILGLVAITSHMTDLKREAEDAVDALAALEGSRLDVAAAKLAKIRADEAVVAATKTVGSRQVDLRNAQAASLANREPGGHPNVADPAVKRSVDALTKSQQNLTDAHIAAGRAAINQSVAEGQLKKDTTDLAKQLVGFGQKATTTVPSFAKPGQSRAPVTDAQQAANAARNQQTALNNFVATYRQLVDQSDKLDAAGKAAGNSVADFVQKAGKIPTKAQFKIIANDIASGKISKIRGDLAKLGLLKPKPKIDADTNAIVAAINHTNHLLGALEKPKKVTLVPSGFDGVSSALSGINRQILHLTSTPFTVKINEAAGKTGHFNAKGQWVYSAEGRKVTKPTLSVAGEDGDEYIIPVSQKHRASGMALWLAAGRDMGVEMNAAGKKPGKTPPPIKRGLGYDPAALDQQKTNEEGRLKNARGYRDTLNTRLKSDHDHHKTLENELATAKRETGSKNKRTAAAAQSRVTGLTKQLNLLDAKIAGEQKARDHQRDVVIPADTKRYELATDAARVGDDHAKKITLWQDRADAATSAMQLASDQWDAADRKKDPAGKAKAYTAWLAAQKDRLADLGQVKMLLGEVQKVVGRTDYGAQIAKDISSNLSDIVQAQDDTQSPGYVDTSDQTPSTDLNDYLFQGEKDALAAAALEEARASVTDDTSDDVTAAQDALGANQWIAARLQQDGAPADIITQALQAVASAKSDLANAVSSNSPSAAGVTADQQAALDQQTARAAASDANAQSAAAALQAFQRSGDLFRGGPTTINVGVQALSAGDPVIQRDVGTAVTKALGAQGGVPTTTGYYRG